MNPPAVDARRVAAAVGTRRQDSEAAAGRRWVLGPIHPSWFLRLGAGPRTSPSAVGAAAPRCAARRRTWG